MAQHLSKLSSLKFFVLDEADRMVEKGHFEELEKILGAINRYASIATNIVIVVNDMTSVCTGLVRMLTSVKILFSRQH
jgi:superfamily II DNA/RNA helicase